MLGKGQDDEDNIVGCARLLPTIEPYLLEKVFPELMSGQLIPKDNKVWELSRFTSMNLNSGKPIESGQINNPTTEPLLRHTIDVAAKHGAEKIISVSPIGIERLLRKMGITSSRAGPVQVINGFPLVACTINIH